MYKFRSNTLFAAFLFVLCSLDARGEGPDDSWNGEEYHENSSSQKDAANDLLKYVILQGNESILDIGSGDGKITAALSERLSSGMIIGIDNSPSMIAFAIQAFPKSEYPNLDFKVIAAEEMDFNQEFDVVFSFTTLQWIKDHSLVIGKVMQSLKEEGKFAATMPMGLPASLEMAVKEVIAEEKWKHYFIDFETGWNFVTAEEYKDYLLAEGFAISRLEVVGQEDIFPSYDAFKGFISQWFPYLRPLPKSEKETFMDQVLAKYLSLDPLDRFGQLHFKIKRLEVISQKKG
jgi:trans-aconitate 2-methyltransferase